MPDHRLPRIAVATGDPAGIGPEVSLKAVLDAGVNGICRPLLVGDPDVIRKHAEAAGLKAELRIISDVKQATWSTGAPEVLAVPLPEGTPLTFGVNDAAYGRAALASAARAIKAALA
ncbi:MAG: hypothetical protein QOK01_2952, partial [Alphaproteobacteria bacterium]|nr:hypothetical protein [Alphaproteobacteria bacterium]